MHSVANQTVRFVGMIALVAAGSCAQHPRSADIREYMAADPCYSALPRGPERVDALFTRATEIIACEHCRRLLFNAGMENELGPDSS